MNFKEVGKLLNKKVFPHKVKYLKLRETYISWLIFTGNFVYKIKKPVKYSYLDFSSLKKRKFFCQEELKLNSRLSKEIYLDVVAIVKRNGKLSILESSESPLSKREKIVEYALKMKEIPEKYYAPALLKRGKLRITAMREIAKIIANFHKNAQASSKIEKYGAMKMIKKNWEENFWQVKPFLGKMINETLYKFIKKGVRNFLKKNKSLFLKRIKEKKIRDCHGDLHTENIFVTPKKIHPIRNRISHGVQIIDCIEFNKRFRYQDIASDVAFLAMDFDYLEKPDFSQCFIAEYNSKMPDIDLFKILPFYQCYRAYVKAKVGCFSLPKPDVKLEEDRVLEIQKYFSLAFKYAWQFLNKKPFLLVIFGQIGTGKTYLAKELSKITGAKLLRSDIIRKQMLGIPLFEHRKKGLEKIYSPEVTLRVYKKMINQGLRLLKKGNLVILDATFPNEFYRKMIILAAKKEKIPYFFVECRAPEKKILERLKKRRKKREISDATVDVYFKKKNEFEEMKLPNEDYISINREKNNVFEDANKVLKMVLNV
jgi:hypothetical protein